MTLPIYRLEELLAHPEPVLHDEAVAFCLLPGDREIGSIPWIGVFREAEGVTLVVADAIAAQYDLTAVFRAAWITLTVHSDLHAVGLTAAVAGALATAGISCNIIAAVHHDHVFVPFDHGAAAMRVLLALR